MKLDSTRRRRAEQQYRKSGSVFTERLCLACLIVLTR
jgi:hypothetical protein